MITPDKNISPAMSTPPAKDPNFKSYLDTDGIDKLKPTPRKATSSISLSDQWAGSLKSLTKLTELAKPTDRDGQPASADGARYHDKLLQDTQHKLSHLSLTSQSGTRYKKTIIDHPRVASYAFAFDIDGVIKNGPETIPFAREAVNLLNGNNKWHILVPYIFVTNGGGNPEADRAKDLSERLGCDVTTEQVIQGHTPMKSLAGTYDSVLVVGGVGDTCRKIAEGYGFKDVYIPLDVMYWNPAVTPYYTLTDDDKKVCKKGLDFSQIEIQAILVFADSRNWAADEQIILELLMSQHGRMGTVSKTFTEGPGIYFAHSDFIWSTDYKLSRYGMGALQVSIGALYKETTGRDLKVTRFGKPQRGTFKYAEKVLSEWRTDVLEEYVEVMAEEPDAENDEEVTQRLIAGLKRASSVKKDRVRRLFKDQGSDSDSDEDSDSSDEGLTIQNLAKLTPHVPQASTVYFVGDTPDSDIRFANAHDASWYSILVKTGVYQDGTTPKYKPKHISDNVLEAVKYALAREAGKELEEWNSTAVEEPKGSK